MGTLRALALTAVTVASFNRNRLLTTMGTFLLVGVFVVLVYGSTNALVSFVLVFSMTADEAPETKNHRCGGSGTKQNTEWERWYWVTFRSTFR